MIPVDYPYALAAARWEEQEKLALKAVPQLERVGLADALRRLRRAHDACDLDGFDSRQPAQPADVAARLSQMESQGVAKVRAVADIAAEVRSLASHFEKLCAKEAAIPKPALNLAQTIQRFATTLGSKWNAELADARSRLKQWQSAATLESGELRMLRRRLDEGLRQVRALAPKPGATPDPDKPPRRIAFLALASADDCKVIMAENITSNHRNLLAGLMGSGGASLRPIRGNCVWENGAYTFVSDRASSSLAKRLKLAISEATRRSVPVKARRPGTKPAA